jgi:hypothetical protein
MFDNVQEKNLQINWKFNPLETSPRNLDSQQKHLWIIVRLQGSVYRGGYANLNFGL